MIQERGIANRHEKSNAIAQHAELAFADALGVGHRHFNDLDVAHDGARAHRRGEMQAVWKGVEVHESVAPNHAHAARGIADGLPAQ